jgi:hypothetical protein
MPPDPGPDPHAHVTKRFVAFMTEHAPGPPSKRRVDNLYGLRSSLAHGVRLLSDDVVRSAMANSPISTSDVVVSSEAALLVKAALINWLWKHDRQPPNLVTVPPQRLRSLYTTIARARPRILDLHESRRASVSMKSCTCRGSCPICWNASSCCVWIVATCPRAHGPAWSWADAIWRCGTL